jgi:HEAT repeat protein
MTPPKMDPADLGSLERLMASDDLWVERAGEGQTLADALLASTSPIVVLLGPARAGKTELIRRWVIPRLEHRITVSYRNSCDAGDAVPDGQPGSILFWDSFEDCLTPERMARRDLVGQIARATGNGTGARLAIILKDEFISRLFQLSPAVPHILDDIREIPALQGDRALDALVRIARQNGVQISDGFASALGSDLNALGKTSSIASELIAILAFELCRANRKGGELGADVYTSLGGLSGLLEAHLDMLFEQSAGVSDPQVGWALLDAIVSQGNGRTLHLDQIAHRFDVAEEVPARILQWLEQDRRIIRRRHDGRYDLVPHELTAAAQSRIRRDRMAVEPARGVLAQGVRHFAESEALLSPQSFRRVHAQRTALTADEAEATLMLRCALAYEDTQTNGAIDYWVRRIPDEDTRVNVLFDATFDPGAGVRERAATRLGEFARPEIRSQLHLLALRDPAPAVRQAAVDALRSLKDEELLRSLVLEIRQSDSPYRLQAIEALRIFAGPEAVSALVATIRSNAEGEDVDARRQSIIVLGLQSTSGAADALLDIAIHDPDDEDRQGAVAALAAISREDTLGGVLNQLRLLTAQATARPLSFSWRSVPWTALHTVVAAGVVLLTGVIHGLSLLCINRRRIAVTLLACEAVGLALVLLDKGQMLGWLMLLATFALGLLIPLRTLLLERVDFKRQGPFRESLSVMLFVGCALTVFTYFHGLACLLARRGRRGLIVFGFQAIGGFFLMTGLYLSGQLSGATQLSIAAGWVLSFLTIGLSILVGTYVAGVGSIVLDAFLWRTRRARLDKIDAIYAELLRNPIASSIVVDSLTGAARGQQSWAEGLVKQFPAQMQEPLRARWAVADPDAQRGIYRLVARHRDAGAVGFLKAHVHAFGWRGRLRCRSSAVALALSAWPKPLLSAGALLLYLQLGAIATLIELRAGAPDNLFRIVHDDGQPLDARREALGRLKDLAAQQRDTHAAEEAATQLALAAAPGEYPMDPELQNEVLRAIEDVAPASRRQAELVSAVAALLGRVETRAPAIEALRKIGTPAAVARLQDFVENPVENSRAAKQSPSQSASDEDSAKMQAIDALARIDRTGTAPLRALMILSGRRSVPSRTVPEGLRKLAGTAAGKLDMIAHAEYFLEEQQYDPAIESASSALAAASSGDARLEARAHAVLGRAYVARGWTAIEQSDYAPSRADFDGAVKSAKWLAASPVDGPNIGREALQGEALSDLIGLGQRLGYVCHEERALRDPKAYAEAREIHSMLEPLATTPAQRHSVGADLAEDNLTVGRHTESVAIARRLLSDPQLDASTALNLRFFVFAGLQLAGDQQGAAQALRELNQQHDSLPAGYSNSWIYTGTKNYIQHAPVTEPEKQLMLDAIARIVAPK